MKTITEKLQFNYTPTNLKKLTDGGQQGIPLTTSQTCNKVYVCNNIIYVAISNFGNVQFWKQ